jgi:hypothetical protein
MGTGILLDGSVAVVAAGVGELTIPARDIDPAYVLVDRSLRTALLDEAGITALRYTRAYDLLAYNPLLAPYLRTRHTLSSPDSGR